jgi:short-subunit dehydrogenase
MKDLNGRTAVLTGASGGLGVYMAGALAEAGMNLVLVAYPGVELELLSQEIEKKGRKAVALALDLREDAQRLQALERARQEFGSVDVLVNNAGVELSSFFHDLPEQWLKDILAVNLEAPMRLSWLVLPEMLKRGSGHIVNISSLAGKAGPGYQEPYAATKAGLVAFTQSLRATYWGTGVSASVICPGFIEAGIYARLKEETGCAAPWTLGTSRPEPVARAVVRAIQKDLPEVIINPLPVRPLFAFIALFPRAGEWLVRQLGVHRFFKGAVEAQKRKQNNLAA